ncbi:MAG: hypothetical protein PVF15_07430 [Candidatus Bathyarchaeota archaeon]
MVDVVYFLKKYSFWMILGFALSVAISFVIASVLVETYGKALGLIILRTLGIYGLAIFVYVFMRILKKKRR